MKAVSYLLAQMDDEDDYPLEDAPESLRKGTTVRLPPELDADLQYISDVWNAFDKARGKKGGKKWKKSTVIQLFVQAGRDRWAKKMGGMPASDADRKEYLRHAKQHFETIAAKAAAERAKKTSSK